MRERHKIWSIAIALIFALAFLVPALGFPSTVLAEPSVTIAFYDDGDLEVITGEAEDIDEDQATVWAEVDTVDDGFDLDDYEITERGFFYGFDESDLDKVVDILISMEDDWDDPIDDWDGFYEEGDYDEDEEDEFWADLSNLDEYDEETWYYMAYIEYEDLNTGDLYYALGDIEEFDLDSGSDVPEVITNSATDIQADSAVLNGELESFGDEDEITDFGFYYGTSSSPSTRARVGDDDDNLDEGDEFEYELDNLKPDTKYYFKAYARNAEGIGYGSVKNFTTKEGTAAPTTTSSVFTIGMNSYLLNGSYQVMDAAPYIKNSRTYLPIRYVGYAMGLTDAQIQWYEATRTVILTKGNSTVVLVIGSTTMFVNGQARVMDVAPEITNSRTCLPIAWVASAFGHTAVWNGSTQQVTIAGVTVPSSGSKDEDAELKLSRSSLTLEPGDDGAITGTLGVDIDDVDYELAGDREFSVDIRITGATFKATIEADSDADDGDEATITFVVTDEDGNEYEAELDVSVEDDSSDEVEVSTSNASRITSEGARLSGAVSDDGGLDIDEFGFYYGTNRSEVSDGEDGDADYEEADGRDSNFYLDLDDLDSDTKYYYMAYAIDEDGDISYGSVKSFSTKN